MDEPEHKRRLRTNRPFIVDNLLGVDEVLDHIRCEEVLSESVIDRISQIKEERQKIRLLLDFLDKKTSDKFDKFCSILDKTDNSLIAAKLRNSADTSSFPSNHEKVPVKRFGSMSDEDREIFRKLHVEFVENMSDVESVMDSLISQEVLNRAHRSLIFQHGERRQQVRMLLNILPKKGNIALPALLTAFKTSSNDYLYEQILKTKRKTNTASCSTAK